MLSSSLEKILSNHKKSCKNKIFVIFPKKFHCISFIKIRFKYKQNRFYYFQQCHLAVQVLAKTARAAWKQTMENLNAFVLKTFLDHSVKVTQLMNNYQNTIDDHP